MHIVVVFISTLLIWSTVPLAMQWSLEGSNYLFNSMGRFFFAVCFSALVLYIRKEPLPVHKKAIMTYIASTATFYSFILMFISLKYIPSGWMAVMYGLSPLITSVITAICFGDKTLSGVKTFGLVLGISGVLIIFSTALDFGILQLYGLACALFSVIMTNTCNVIVKKIDAKLTPLAITAGGIIGAFPLYVLTWACVDGSWPVAMPGSSIIALLYVGLFGTGIVFLLFYYLLKHLSLTRVAVIGILTPVCALIVGNLFNSEPFNSKVIAGTALILISVYLYEFHPLRLDKPVT